MFLFSTKFSFTFPASFCGSSTADVSSLSQGVMADRDGQAFVEEGCTNFNSGEDEIGPPLPIQRVNQNRDLPKQFFIWRERKRERFFLKRWADSMQTVRMRNWRPPDFRCFVGGARVDDATCRPAWKEFIQLGSRYQNAKKQVAKIAHKHSVCALIHQIPGRSFRTSLRREWL